MVPKKAPKGESTKTPTSGDSSTPGNGIKKAKTSEEVLVRRLDTPTGMLEAERRLIEQEITIPPDPNVKGASPLPPPSRIEVGGTPDPAKESRGNDNATGVMPAVDSQKLLEQEKGKVNGTLGAWERKHDTPPLTATQSELKKILSGDTSETSAMRKAEAERAKKWYNNRKITIPLVIAELAITTVLAVFSTMVVVNHYSGKGKGKYANVPEEVVKMYGDQYVTPETLMFWTNGKPIPIRPGEVVGRDGKPIDENDTEQLLEFAANGFLPKKSREQAMHTIKYGENGLEFMSDERREYVASKLMGVLETTDSGGAANMAGKLLAEIHPVNKIDDLVRLIIKEDFKWRDGAGNALLGIVERQQRDIDPFSWDRMRLFTSLLKLGKDRISPETYRAAVMGIGLTKGKRIASLKKIIEEDYCDTCGFPEKYKMQVEHDRKVHPAFVGLVSAGRWEKNVDLMLVNYLKDKNPEIRGDAAWALGQFTNDPTNLRSPLLVNGTAAEEGLVAGLKDENPGVRVQCARSLANLMLMGSVPALVGALNNPHELVREEAAEALGEMKAKEALGALLIVAENDPDEEVCKSAAHSVKQITGKSVEEVKKMMAEPVAAADAATDAAADAATDAATDAVQEPEEKEAEPEVAPAPVITIPAIPVIEAGPEPEPEPAVEQAAEAEAEPAEAGPEPEKKTPKKKKKKKKKSKKKDDGTWKEGKDFWFGDEKEKSKKKKKK